MTEKAANERTPGPWHVAVDNDGSWEERLPSYVTGVQGNDGRWVVRFDDDYGTNQGADARLIAEAPAMAELLEEVVAAHDEGIALTPAAACPDGCPYGCPYRRAASLLTRINRPGGQE